MRIVRTTVAVLSSIALLVLALASCGTAPTATPTAAPTASPTAGGPTSTPGPTSSIPTQPLPTHEPNATDTPAASPSPSPTPTPRPTSAAHHTLPKSALAYIGIGTIGWSILEMAGVEPEYNAVADSSFFLEGGGRVTFDYESAMGNGDPLVEVVGITVVDGSGTHVQKAGVRQDGNPYPDSWFIFQKGSLSLKIAASTTIADLTAALGDPLLDEWDVGFSYLTWSVGWIRDMEFPGLRVKLIQTKDAADKTQWKVESARVSDASFGTPIGWKVGMSASEVIAKAGTIDWLLEPELGPDGTLASLRIYERDMHTYGSNVLLRFVHDEVSSISLTMVSVGA